MTRSARSIEASSQYRSIARAALRTRSTFDVNEPNPYLRVLQRRSCLKTFLDGRKCSRAAFQLNNAVLDLVPACGSCPLPTFKPARSAASRCADDNAGQTDPR